MLRLIVPLDLSPGSEKALDYALMLSRHQAAEITIIYVCPEPRGWQMISEEAEEKLAKEMLSSLVGRRAAELGKSSQLRFVIRRGLVFREVLREAKPVNDCRLILTSHGSSGYDHKFIGGNAYRLIAGSRMPSFVIPVSMEVPELIKRILVPLDDSYETLEKIPASIDLARQFNAKVYLATVTTSHISDIRYQIRASSDRAENMLRKAGVPFETELLFGSSISNLALEFADEVDADVISIMSERVKNSQNSLIGHYAHHMVTKSTRPLMIHDSAPAEVKH